MKSSLNFECSKEFMMNLDQVNIIKTKLLLPIQEYVATLNIRDDDNEIGHNVSPKFEKKIHLLLKNIWTKVLFLDVFMQLFNSEGV